MSTIPRLRRALRTTDRALGDIRAVQVGRVPQRVANRLLGRVLGRVTRGLWR